MIAPAGNHSREALPQLGKSLTDTQAPPDSGFEQLLDSLATREEGFLGDGPGTLLAPAAAALQLPGAEMFNERGLFARGSAAAGAFRAAHEAGTVPPASDPECVAGANPTGPATPVLPAPVGPEGALREPPAGPLAPLTTGPAAGLQEAYPGAISAKRADAKPPAPAPPVPRAPEASATVPAVPTESVPDLKVAALPQVGGRPAPHQTLNRTVVRLDTASGSIAVTAHAEGLTLEERDRLERRIAGELARHGLAIGRITVSAPQANSSATEGE